MGKNKKCYQCSTETEENAKVCPKCGTKLGAKMESGMAAKPGSPLLKILFVVLLLAAAGKIAGRVSSANPPAAPVNPPAEPAKAAAPAAGAKDGLILSIKEKGAASLNALGVDDIGYKDDALRFYVDQRFINLDSEQQEQLVKIVANEWSKALGKESTPVEIIEYGTGKTLAELVLK